MMLMPRSLFGRTALLIAVTIAVFAVISWQAIIWTALVPSAEAAASLLTERAHAALAAQRSGGPLPEGARFESGGWVPMKPRYAGLALRTYMERVRSRVAANLDASEVRIQRYAAPSEIWVRTPERPDAWLVLTWRIAGPGAPLATLVVWGAAAALALGAAALSARRLTAPLAELAAAAARVAEGERVQIETASGPSEVRSLAVAFQSMSHRLAELDAQRELMLAGISHDLRTPLARLRVAAELLDKDDAALTREITANVEEMDRMIGQFLHYARAGFRETPAGASLDEIARQTLAIYASDERLRLELGAADARLFAIDSVRHMLLNLAQNALEYGRPPVTVRTSATATAISFEVRDRGAGLSAAQWAEAMRPFHRLQDRPGGTHAGLGLAMVERLVRMCGGSWEGRQIEGGFTVTVRLPAASLPPNSAEG
jgi:two-component system osmolarity sensor histidine kinase EnvZ